MYLINFLIKFIHSLIIIYHIFQGLLRFNNQILTINFNILFEDTIFNHINKNLIKYIFLNILYRLNVDMAINNKINLSKNNKIFHGNSNIIKFHFYNLEYIHIILNIVILCLFLNNFIFIFYFFIFWVILNLLFYKIHINLKFTLYSF